MGKLCKKGKILLEMELTWRLVEEVLKCHNSDNTSFEI